MSSSRVRSRSGATEGSRGNRARRPNNLSQNMGVRLLDEGTYKGRWDVLKNLPIEATRYYSTHALEELGIESDVWKLIDRIGWTRLLRGRWSTYKRITLEILSTLEVHKTSRPSEPISMSFQLDNEQRTLSINQLNNIYELPLGGLYREPREFDPNEFWKELVQSSDSHTVVFNPKSSKASWLRNPVFRYIARLLSSSVFARHEFGGIRKDELFAIWCMLSGTRMNIGAYFMEQLLRVAKKTSGIICIGGMLTPIADYFNVDYTSWEKAPVANPSIDLQALMAMKMLAKVECNYYLLQRNGEAFLLPNTSLTTVDTLDDKSNWLMDSAAHQAVLAQSPMGVQPRELHREVASDDETFPQPMHEDIPESSTARASRGDYGVRLDALEDRVTNIEERQVQNHYEMMQMMQAMRQWQIDFSTLGRPPPPPPQ